MAWLARYKPLARLAAGGLGVRPTGACLRAQVVHFASYNSSRPLRRPFSSSPSHGGDLVVEVPQLAESITEGTLSRLAKGVGDYVEVDEELASIETDKIDVSVNAPEAGLVAELFASAGDVVTVGQRIVRIETGAEAGAAAQKKETDAEEESKRSKPEPVKEEANKTSEKPVPEPGKEDVKKIPEKQAPGPKVEPVAPAPEKPAQQMSTPPTTLFTSAPAAGPSRGERLEKMSRLRKTIAQRLKQSQDMCASLTTVQEVDMSALMQWRKRYKDEMADSYGVRLGYMGAFTKAATLAAQEVPQINAAINLEREVIVFRDYVDISIAVSAPKGLITPVLRNCERLSIVQMEAGIAALAKKGRDGKLTLDDLQGGNFSISNPGIFGSMFGTPLINYPQAAVFNMNSISERVVAINGKPEIRPMMYITVTYDHRLIDGREAVTFLSMVKKYIEDPSRMLLA